MKDRDTEQDGSKYKLCEEERLEENHSEFRRIDRTRRRDLKERKEASECLSNEVEIALK